MKWLFTLIVGIGLARCAESRPPGSSHLDEAADASRQIEQLEAELQRAEAGAGPNCERERMLTRNICELAERICSLAGDHPSEVPMRPCTDGRERCEGARARTRSRCGDR